MPVWLLFLVVLTFVLGVDDEQGLALYFISHSVGNAFDAFLAGAMKFSHFSSFCLFEDLQFILKRLNKFIIILDLLPLGFNDLHSFDVLLP
jgi:hypothetical protein